MGPRLLARVGHIRAFALAAALEAVAILLFPILNFPEAWFVLRVITGLCNAILFMAIETWLNDRATNEIRGRPIKKKLVYAVTSEPLAKELRTKKYAAVVIPGYEYSRVEKVKVALVAGRSAGLLHEGDTVLAAVGKDEGRTLDTLMRVRLGSEEEEKVSVDSIGLSPEFSSQVVEALVHLAMEIGAEGYEAGRTAILEQAALHESNPQRVEIAGCHRYRRHGREVGPRERPAFDAKRSRSAVADRG
jgi:hypothetical protein